MFWHDRRRMWLRRPIPRRLWVRDGGAKHGPLQQRPDMWCLFRAHLCKLTMVQTKGRSNQNHGSTNFCPPNYSPPVDIHWCNPSNKHFDLSMKIFTSNAEYKSGIVPVKFRRVKCQKRDGVRFEVKGNPKASINGRS